MERRYVSQAEGVWTLLGQPESVQTKGVLLSSGGGLVLYSPAAMDAGAREQLATLGSVSTIIAPNAFHHLHARAAKEATGARVIGPKAVVRKQPGLVDFVASLGQPGDAGPDIELESIGGLPGLSETVLYHRPSRSLVVADLFMNIQAPRGAGHVLTFLTGTRKRFAMSRVLRFLTKDRRALSESLEKVLDWDFDRVVPCHGEVVAAGGKDFVAKVVRAR